MPTKYPEPTATHYAVTYAAAFSADTTFIPSGAAYAAGTVVDIPRELVFADAADHRLPSRSMLRVSTTAFRAAQTPIPAGQTSFNLHLYSQTPPSAQADGAAWSLATADLPYYLGMVSLGTPVLLGASQYVRVPYQDMDCRLVGSSAWGRLVTVGASTLLAVPRLVTIHGIAL